MAFKVGHLFYKNDMTLHIPSSCPFSHPLPPNPILSLKQSKP
jgi:hypothetical protein